MNRILPILAVCTLLLTSTRPAPAAPLVIDGYDYPDDAAAQIGWR